MFYHSISMKTKEKPLQCTANFIIMTRRPYESNDRHTTMYSHTGYQHSRRKTTLTSVMFSVFIIGPAQY